MAKAKFSVLSFCKNLGMTQLRALPGIKTYETHRVTRFMGNAKQMAEIAVALEQAGYELVLQPHTFSTMRAELGEGRYVELYQGYVAYGSPKAHKTYSGPIYD